jgi:hypothetical protein
LPQIRQDCLKRGPVAVDVGYNCDAHQVLFPIEEGTTGSTQLD